VWESNPPCPFVTGNTGFEVQEGHQNPMHSRLIQYSIFIITKLIPLRSEMKIEHYSFGKITVDGQTYTSDLIIYPDRVDASWWRKEGHNLQPEDLKDVLNAKPDVLIIGTGFFGVMRVPKETTDYLKSKGIRV
jgi:hypothetical protein